MMVLDTDVAQDKDTSGRYGPYENQIVTDTAITLVQ